MKLRWKLFVYYSIFCFLLWIELLFLSFYWLKMSFKKSSNYDKTTFSSNNIFQWSSTLYILIVVLYQSTLIISIVFFRSSYTNSCLCWLGRRGSFSSDSSIPLQDHWTSVGRSTLVGQRPMKSLSSVCPSVTKFSQD